MSLKQSKQAEAQGAYHGLANWHAKPIWGSLSRLEAIAAMGASGDPEAAPPQERGDSGLQLYPPLRTLYANVCPATTSTLQRMFC